ncbi:MAG: superoxide dismutase, Ni [Methylococcales bacterium]|nr:superoxide dismutase, Ni [Methylococcales bacterium]
MLYKLVQSLDTKFNFPTASAHCDIPCKIYDPIVAQISALTMLRMVDLIEEHEQSDIANHANNFNTLTRFVTQKEEHGIKLKQEIQTIWGDYIKQPQLDMFPNLHALTHSIMLKASYCKQQVDRPATLELLNLVNEFAEFFWESKGISTTKSICPYPPAEKVVYPNLKQN